MLGLLGALNPKLIAYAVVSLIAVGFAVSWHVRGARITELRADVVRLETELQTQQALLEQAREASARLGQRLQEREAARQGIGRVTEGIARATPDQDGPVAPVLRDALHGLGRLRQPNDQGRGP